MLNKFPMAMAKPIQIAVASQTKLLSTDNAILTQTMKLYHQCLLQNERARQYLSDRKLLDDQALTTFQLGFVDRSLGLELKKLSEFDEDVNRGVLQRLGLIKPSGHEFFRGAIVFPIGDDDKQIVGCYGRRLTDKLRSKSPVHLSWQATGAAFFNLQALVEHEDVIYCKSPLEVLSWWQFGIKNAISSLTHFTTEHAQILINHNIAKVYLAMGSTAYALAEARKIARLLLQYQIDVLWVLYPNGWDTNSLVLHANNPEAELVDLLRLSQAFRVSECHE